TTAGGGPAVRVAVSATAQGSHPGVEQKPSRGPSRRGLDAKSRTSRKEVDSPLPPRYVFRRSWLAPLRVATSDGVRRGRVRELLHRGSRLTGPPTARLEPRQARKGATVEESGCGGPFPLLCARRRPETDYRGDRLRRPRPAWTEAESTMGARRHVPNISTIAPLCARGASVA